MDIGKQKRVIIVEKERVAPSSPADPNRPVPLRPEPSTPVEHGR